ncbi:MAG TPA: pyridoxamine 5'-phosphate oxidase family protein [Blastococcus sp.]|nr:pyridoxamine 5'-phosphate oxidase family protein [Blastococcus sp.]
MPTTDEDRAQELLTECEARRLLATVAIGRLAFTSAALPDIQPVSFAVHDGQVLIPARRGSRLVDAVRGAVVAFQADAYDARRTGWSVTVVGPSRVVSDPVHVTALNALYLAPGAPTPNRCYVAVQLELVHGYRTGCPPD